MFSFAFVPGGTYQSWPIAGPIRAQPCQNRRARKSLSLADLRRDIDRIDEAMHALLIERSADHRPPDRGEEDAGIRLRVPPGPRSRHDAAAGRAPSRQPAARNSREHLARHHRHLHLCPGAVRGPRRPVGRRRADARFRAIPFRLHRAARAAYGSGERRRGCQRVQRRPRPRARRSPLPAPDRGGRRSNSRARRKSSRGCRSSSAPIIRPACRCSSFRASPPTPW